jgi:outer membrane protein assembly factor BamE (lipoprotein component of BamABCDE complex)
MAVVVSSAVAGCASSGTKMEQENLQKIVIGVTTKDQMIGMFGPPLSQSYGTEGKLTMLWHYMYVGPFGTGMKQQNLAVLFDQKERIEKYNMVDGSGGGVRLGR